MRVLSRNILEREFREGLHFSSHLPGGLVALRDAPSQQKDTERPGHVIVGRQRKISANARTAVAVLCLMTIGLTTLSMVEGCDVSVHRYMLERWEREFYWAYYFYSGEKDEADREVNKFLEDAGSSFGSNVNVTFRAVDVDTLDSNALTVVDKEVWNEHRSDKLPFHLVLTPRGTLLFRGRLDTATAKSMIHSPMRARIARELCSGKDGLLLLLAGADEKENQRAEKEVRWVVETAKKEHELNVGFLRLSRKDPREEWLVRSLLSLTEGPPNDGECIVFGICGRGRVLAGCIGEGITRRNIIDCVAIMNGDCSCDLRWANPGIDLLTDWDWDGAIADLPLVAVEPMQSVLLGFDDLDEGSQESSQPEHQGGRQSVSRSLFGTQTLTKLGLAFGIASIIVVGIGLMMIRKRREL